MPLLVAPYLRGRLFVFVVHPRIRMGILVACLLAFAVALIRASAIEGGAVRVLVDGVLYMGAAFVVSPMWNRFVIGPMCRRLAPDSLTGMYAFFELFFLLGAPLLLLALAIG